MKNSVKRRPEEITGLISEWQQSNMSKKGFCAQKGINYQTFIGWMIQRRNKEEEKKFIPVQVEAHSGLFAEISLGGSRKVVLHQRVDVEFIKAVLKC